MRNHHNDATKYDSETSMSIVVYDEKKDDWAKIGFFDALNRAIDLRFNSSGAPDDDDGRGPGGEDVFGFRDTDYAGDESYQTAEFFGQMEQGGNNTPDHLPYEAIRAFAQSAEARLGGLGNGDEITDALVALRAADEAEADLPDTAGDRKSGAGSATNKLLELITEKLGRLFPALGKIGSVGDDTDTGGPGGTGHDYAATHAYMLRHILLPRPEIIEVSSDKSADLDVTTLQLVDKSATLAEVLAVLGAPGKAVAVTDDSAKTLEYLIKNFTCRKSTLKDPKSHKNWKDAEAMVTKDGGGGEAGFKRTNKYASRGFIKADGNKDKFVLFPAVTGNFKPVTIGEYREKLLEYYPPVGFVHKAHALL